MQVFWICVIGSIRDDISLECEIVTLIGSPTAPIIKSHFAHGVAGTVLILVRKPPGDLGIQNTRLEDEGVLTAGMHDWAADIDVDPIPPGPISWDCTERNAADTDLLLPV